MLLHQPLHTRPVRTQTLMCEMYSRVALLAHSVRISLLIGQDQDAGELCGWLGARRVVSGSGLWSVCTAMLDTGHGASPRMSDETAGRLTRRTGQSRRPRGPAPWPRARPRTRVGCGRASCARSRAAGRPPCAAASRAAGGATRKFSERNAVLPNNRTWSIPRRLIRRE